MDNNIDESKVIKPIWKGGQGINRYIKYAISGVTLSALVSEMLNKKYGFGLSPSHIISELRPIFTVLSGKTGEIVAQMSDIMYVVVNVLDFLSSYIRPFLSLLFSSMADIINALKSVFLDSVISFLKSYNIGLMSSYNIVATQLTTVFGVGGGLILSLSILEAIGLSKGRNFLRPSHCIIKYVANPLYVFIYDFVYVYSYIGGTISNIKKVLVKIISYLMPFIRPYIAQISVASSYVKLALYDTVASLWNGINIGFTDAVVEHKFVAATVTFALTTLTGFYFCS